MSLIKDVVAFATGGGGKVLWDAVESFFPTPEAKLQAKIAMDAAAAQQEKQQLDSALAFAESLNERISQQEGTAADLKSIPIVGPLMLFLRGAQRPVWGYAVLFMDYQVYSGIWKLDASRPEESAVFYIINFLVLGFLFGERAIINILPLVQNFLSTVRNKQGA